MRAYIHSGLTFVLLASTVVGCGSGSSDASDDGGTALGAEGSLGSASGAEASSSLPGSSSGSDAGSIPGVDSGAGSGFDAGSSPETGASSDAGSSAAADAHSETGSSTGTDSGAGSGSDAGACFASGLNVAWINFASDIPVKAGELATFQTLFANTAAAGGHVVRWWLHTNGTVTPGYDANGNALAISAQNITDIKSILDAANTAGILLNISLWSFDMLQGAGSETGLTSTVITNNTNLLTVDANRQAYITNYLTPLVTALVGYHGLYSYEIFNEPEGMASNVPNAGWATNKVEESFIQRSVNWLASAIHTADPGARVTNAAWTFQACSSTTNYYSDSALQAAGGMTNGTLDFYEVHYYSDNGTTNSCFANKASHWGLDKPIVMGEFYALAQDGVTAADTYTTLFTNGYNGAWAWQYESNDGANANNDQGADSTKWPAMQVPMQNLLSADPGALCQ